MLEILVLLALTKRIGAIVEQKGYKSGRYKLLTVVLWFSGEILGAILGTAMASGSSDAQCTVYIVAFMGAAAGAAIAYLIANNLSPTDQPSQTLPTAEPASSKPIPANIIEARIAANLCPKCGNAVAPAAQNCPSC